MDRASFEISLQWLSRHSESGFVRGMCEIDEQTNPVHLSDEFAPGGAETSVGRRFGLAIAKGVLSVVD